MDIGEICQGEVKVSVSSFEFYEATGWISLNESKGNPLVDLDHWNLLSDIITPSKNVSQAASHTRPVKIWLVPLIHRTSFASTVTAYLGLSVGLDIATKSTLDHSFYRCLQSLWPLAAPKLSTETTLDIFGASLDSLRASSLQQPQNLDPSGSIKICSMITSCYRSSLSNASNRKKVRLASACLIHRF